MIFCISTICPQATHELEPELILSKELEQYSNFFNGFMKEYATKNRDMVLEALSDSGTVAPLIMTANLHSRANPKSYMYVFSHPKAMQDYSGVSRSLNDTTKIDYRGSDASRQSGTRHGTRKMLRIRRREGGGWGWGWTDGDDELKCTCFNAPIRAASCNVVVPWCGALLSWKRRAFLTVLLYRTIYVCVWNGKFTFSNSQKCGRKEKKMCYNFLQES